MSGPSPASSVDATTTSAPPSTAITPPPVTVPPTSAGFDTLAAAIYGLQRQMGQLATRLSVRDGPRESPPPSSMPYGLPGFGGLPAHGLHGAGPVASAPPASAVVVHTEGSTQLPHPSTAVPITQIAFPHSPSPIPNLDDQSPYMPSYDAHADTLGVPRFHKLSFLTYDGKDDPLGWLNKCDHS